MLAVVLVVIFIISNLIGDPVALMLPTEATAAQREELAESLGLTGSWWDRLGAYLERVASGTFGQSLWQDVPAMQLVLGRLPVTFYLAGVAFLISVPTAVLMGSIAAFKPRSLIDRFVNVSSLGGVSTVDFWAGLMLIMIFSVGLGWTRTGGFGPGLAYVILPALTLSFRAIGRIAQLTRSAMLDEYSKPYVRMARAKGMPEHRIFFHALKNAAIPVVTLSGDEFNHLLNGAIVVEVVFAWPGIGLLLLQAIERRDLFLIEATIAVIAVLAIVVNLIVDLLYTSLNPKISYR